VEESEAETDFESCASASEPEREEGESGDVSDGETEAGGVDFDTPRRTLSKAGDVFGSGNGGAGNLPTLGAAKTRTEVKDGSSENVVVCVRLVAPLQALHLGLLC